MRYPYIYSPVSCTDVLVSYTNELNNVAENCEGKSAGNFVVIVIQKATRLPEDGTIPEKSGNY